MKERPAGNKLGILTTCSKEHASLCGSRRFEDQFAPPAYLGKECRKRPFEIVLSQASGRRLGPQMIGELLLVETLISDKFNTKVC
jgi:hypothetical protein